MIYDHGMVVAPIISPYGSLVEERNIEDKVAERNIILIIKLQTREESRASILRYPLGDEQESMGVNCVLGWEVRHETESE